ncbi:MAG: non-heme iron oxygenase ferredoxin subunit [Chloroflexi bacterium]|nr:non-heme iron oxygenase ferredoxin subunit [Chloroflexota bacterium]
MVEKSRPHEDETYTFVPIIPYDQLGVGERLFIEIDNQPIVLLKIEGDVFAIADKCSHDDGPLGDGEVNDHIIKCPRHGATFDIRTGKALSLPAIVAIHAFPIKIIDGVINIGINKRG